MSRRYPNLRRGRRCGRSSRTALERAAVPPAEREARTSEALGRAGFIDFETPAAALSGGWRKRLRITEGLVQQADVLLLDEPTNHLDFAGIEWLESLLQNAPFACVVVSHDRYFLENVASEVVELNRVYCGWRRCASKETTAQFLEKKEEYLDAQGKRQDALTNRVHTELEWLRRGPRARRTKAKARIDKAHELIGELADLNSRSRTATAKIDFSATDRQTKQLIALEGVTYAIGDRTLFARAEFHHQGGNARGAGGPKWERQDHAASFVARRHSTHRAVRFAGLTRCGSSTSIKTASSILTSLCAAPWRRIAIRWSIKTA